MNGQPQRASDAPPPRDEVAERRALNQQVPQHIPQQRPTPLSEPEREQYEQRLDAYEVEVSQYRSKLRDVVAQLDAAHHDGLTGTWLRKAGQRLLEQELQRAARTDSPLSIAFVDVDGLKALNDTEGHAAGDVALVAVARTLLSGLRGYDHVIRWGGDEFLCVLPAVTHAEAVRRLTQARTTLLAERGIGISLGVVERHAGENVESLVARADQTLYEGREQRRGR